MTLDEFVANLTEKIDLPQIVCGRVEAKTNVHGKVFINLTRLTSLDFKKILLPDDSLLSSVYICHGNSDSSLVKKYTELNGEDIIAELILNNRERQKEGYVKKNYTKPLKARPILIENVVAVCQKENDIISKEIINLLKEEYQLDDLNIKETKLKSLQSDISVKQKQFETLEKNIKSKTETFTDIEKELTTKQDELQETIGELEPKRKKLAEIKEETKKIKTNFQIIASFLPNKYTNQTKSSITTRKTLAFEKFKDADGVHYDTLINYLHQFILTQGIYYTRETLLDFFALVRTHDFIVLAGQSGTGKTSLIKHFAKAVHGKSFIIPVKPNWMSKEDLLGYYNPIQQRYMPTEFLEALLEAQRNPETPYFICLDEMNLARVEYYFADFLSKMEERTGEIIISLYSEDLLPNYQQLAEILKSVKEAKINEENINSYPELKGFIDLHFKTQVKTTKEYVSYFHKLAFTVPPQVSIGHNVHFFGTANIDETSYYFSNKVLDRVQVMTLPHPFDLDIEKNINSKIKNYDFSEAVKHHLTKNHPVDLPIDVLGERAKYPELSSEKELQAWIKADYEKYYKALNVDVGFRLVRQALHYHTQLQFLLGNNEDKKEIKVQSKNAFIKHKILPRMSIKNESDLESLRKMIEAFKNRKLAIAKELYELQKKAENNNNIANYWS